MRLPSPLLRLSPRFDAERMAAEVEALASDLWIAHPQSFPDNTALLLVSHRGEPADDSFSMPMAATDALKRCPYLRQVLASLGTTIGRTRLMRIGPGGECQEHIDAHPYWDRHLRLHIPIVTDPQVSFYCGYQRANMAPGECWTFDSGKPHKVVNNSETARIHLVCDTVDASQVLTELSGDQDSEPLLFDPVRDSTFKTEADWESIQHEPEAPIFVLGPPRSGTTLLFEALNRARGLFSIGGESHELIESIPGLHPAAQDWESNRLTEVHAQSQVRDGLLNGLHRRLHDRDGLRPSGPYRWLEKTPKNILRIPFLRSLFPDARFVFVHRDPRATISSMLDGWRSGRFVIYGRLPDWEDPPWSFLLVPGWRDLNGLPLERVVATQWARAVGCMLDDAAGLEKSRCSVVHYSDLCRDPNATLSQLCERLDLTWDQPVTELPLSAHTLSPPHPDKWKRNESEIISEQDTWGPVAERLEAVLAGLED